MGWWNSRPGYTTVSDVAVMYGRTRAAVEYWIKNGLLEAETYENELPKFWISDQALQKFDKEVWPVKCHGKHNKTKKETEIMTEETAVVTTPASTPLPLENLMNILRDICAAKKALKACEWLLASALSNAGVPDNLVDILKKSLVEAYEHELG